MGWLDAAARDDAVAMVTVLSCSSSMSHLGLCTSLQFHLSLNFSSHLSAMATVTTTTSAVALIADRTAYDVRLKRLNG